MNVFSVSLREMMQRATSAACAVPGLDGRDSDREDSGIAIPTLNWPPDPPRYESLKSGQYYSVRFLKDSWITMVTTLKTLSVR